jgi:hypothetical protein
VRGTADADAIGQQIASAQRLGLLDLVPALESPA